MSALIPKKHTFQFGLLLFLVMSLSAGIILANSRGSYTNPKASDDEVYKMASPSPSPTVTPKVQRAVKK